MAIEVRIPTILRTYTDGAKAVEGSGDTLRDLIDDVETRHPGLRDRIVEGDGLRRFVNVYLNDEDVRFLGGLGRPRQADGDDVTVPPAGGQAADGPLRLLLDSLGRTPLVGLPTLSPLPTSGCGRSSRTAVPPGR